MKSSTTPEFWQAYAALPADLKKAARKNFRLWLRNPRHGSLQFQRRGRYWCARVTPGCRALAVAVPDGYLWFWIGGHDEYERMLGGG
jgi:hypothetical protein